jgi:hypothetical protein
VLYVVFFLVKDKVDKAAGVGYAFYCYFDVFGDVAQALAGGDADADFVLLRVGGIVGDSKGPEMWGYTVNQSLVTA